MGSDRPLSELNAGDVAVMSQRKLSEMLNRLAEADQPADGRALLLALMCTANRRSSVSETDLDGLARLAGLRRGRPAVRAALRLLVRIGAIAPDERGYRLHPLLFGSVSPEVRARLLQRWEALNRAENLKLDRHRSPFMSPATAEKNRTRALTWAKQHRPTAAAHRELQARVAELEARNAALRAAQMQAQVEQLQEAAGQAAA